TECREHQRDDTEEHRHLHEQHVLRNGLAHAVVHRIDDDRQRPIDVFDRTTNWTDETRRIPANVHREFGLPRLAHGRIVEREVHLATRFIADVAALEIPHDPDDGVRDAIDRHRTAEWVASTEV